MEQKLSLICLPRQELKFDKNQIQIIVGSLLGDASLKKISENNYKFIESHSEKQEEYLFWKNSFLNFNISQLSRGETEINKGNIVFKKFYELFYPTGKKEVSEKILGLLTPLSLAIWYIDDGYYLYSTKTVGISTCGFNKFQNELIIDWFKDTLNIKFKLNQDKKGYFFIRADVENSNKFLNLIRDIIKKMPQQIQYKVGEDKIKIESARLNRNKLSRKFRKENPDKLRETNQNYYKNNQNKILIQKKEYGRKKYGYKS